MKSLAELLLDACLELEAIDIETGIIQSIKPNSRAKRRWGQCKRVRGGFEIEISTQLLQDDVSYEATMNTVIHELLHTCQGCMNHGPKWKALANKVNSFYPQYDIKRCTSASEKGIAAEVIDSQWKYEITCEHCGALLGKYQKAGKIVSTLQKGISSRYACSLCRSHSLKVTEL